MVDGVGPERNGQMIIHPSTRELSDIAKRMGMDQRTAAKNRKLILGLWKEAIYQSVKFAYNDAITQAIVRALGQRMAKPKPFVPVSLADLLPRQPDDPGVAP